MPALLVGLAMLVFAGGFITLATRAEQKRKAKADGGYDGGSGWFGSDGSGDCGSDGGGCDGGGGGGGD